MAANSSVGLDIGTTAVRAAQISSSGGGIRLDRFGEVALPPGAVREGEVHDIDAVAAAIRELRATAKLTTKRVALGVASRRVVVRQLDLPWMPLADLKRSLSLHVQDVLPMPVESAYLDVHPIEELVGQDGLRQLRVLLVAAARESVQCAIEATTRAGLVVESVDLLPLALLRALGSGQSDVIGDRMEALVDIGAQLSNIVIHRGGRPLFVRILLRGGDQITGAVSDRLGVPFAAAEDLKRGGVSPVPLDSTQAGEARQAFDAAVAGLIDDVRGSLEYFAASGGGGRVDRILLSGGSSRLPGLVERMAGETRLPVELARPMELLSTERLKGAHPDRELLNGTASVPLGLALAGV